MKTKTTIWLGVGAFVAGRDRCGWRRWPASCRRGLRPARAPALSTGDATPSAGFRPVVIAQHADHGQDAGEGGEAKSLANLPPDLAFAARIALLRGHLLVGDELVKQQQWNAALPHFLHPDRGDLRRHQGSARPVTRCRRSMRRSRRSPTSSRPRRAVATTPRRSKPVNDALAAADAGMKAKQANWPGFVVEAAVEALKAAAGEYQQAVVGGRIAKPVEYQDARGFVWQADRMIESVAAGSCKRRTPRPLDRGACGTGRAEEGLPVRRCRRERRSRTTAACSPTCRASSLLPAS